MKKIVLFIAILLLGNLAHSQIITTIAGTGTSGNNGDGFAATNAELINPAHLAFDNSGNIFVTDYAAHVVRKIDTFGIITTFAGTGSAGYSGDHFAATNATLNGPNGIAADNAGNIYIADEENSVVRKVDPAGIITTIAGIGIAGYNGDDIAATTAKLNRPDGVAVDDTGNIFIADTHEHRVRKINTAGIITTIGGTGSIGFSGDGGPATAAIIDGPTGICVSPTGNIYVVDQSNQRLRLIDTSGKINTIAGNGTLGFYGDGGPAIAAEFYYPSTVALDPSGNIYINDSYNNRVRMIDEEGYIQTVAGTGVPGLSGDNGPATAAELNQPWGAELDRCGNLYIGDAFNHVVRKITYFTGMPAITGPSILSVGATDTLTIAQTGGIWSSGSTSTAIVGSGSGIVSGIAAGIAIITYTNLCGSSTYAITVSATTAIQNIGIDTLVSLTPNPNKGEITIKGQLPGMNNLQEVTVDVIDMTGRTVYSAALPIFDKSLNSLITLSKSIPNGLYLIKFRTENMYKTIRFSLDR